MRVLGDLSRLSARRQPHKQAMVMGDEALTFAEIDRNSNQLAHALLGLGVQPGDRVALLAQNRLDYVVVSQAVAKCGAILVPISFRFAPAEIGYVLSDAEPKVLFAEPEFDAPVREALRTLATEPAVVGLAAEGTGAFAGSYPATQPEVSVEPASAAAIMYTSGTTGFPKGVLYSHTMYLRLYDAQTVEGDIDRDDVIHVAMPMFHNAGLNGALNQALLVGATGVVHRGSFDSETVLASIERYRITLAVWVPTMFTILADRAADRRYDLSSLKKIFYGGMPITPEGYAQAKRMFSARLYQFYGSTEAGPIGVLRPEDHERWCETTGREVYNCESRIVDDRGRDVPVGGVGEVIVRAATSGMIGYWRNERATRETMRDGWIHTGDLARVEPEGFFTVVDRKSDLIISGAENIYPKEVEAVLSLHPAVREVAVFGIPDPKYGEAVCAAISLRPGAALTAEEVEAFCVERLARFKRPRRIDFHDELPKNAAGKIVKTRLRRPYWEGRNRSI
ncbi:MAG: long-chain-fatty-acid--CoA ligase [Deltaproteobacteria bacterium]|nr:long-chain-fatty-acid--CoA ligase [Deltaproteobacteria bacterium]